MLIVTGANGQLGRLVVESLVARVSPSRVVASVRDTAKAGPLADRGVSVRAGDFADAAALANAFRGAEQVLVVSLDSLGAPAIAKTRTAIDAAVAAGAKRVFYTSHMGARADSPFAAGVDHAAVEAILAQCGTGWTSLRHGFYAESAMHMIGRGIAAGEIRTPADGPVSWTSRADLADADAALLAGERAFDGPTPPLTAGESFTMAELAAVASEATGRDIKHTVVTDDDFRAGLVAAGTPEPFADMFLGFYKAARRGDFATVDPTLEQLIGRRPTTMREFLAKALQSGSGH